MHFLDLFIFSIVALLLILIFVLLPLSFSYNSAQMDSSSPIESGFSMLGEDISFFNNHFFIVLVIFVLFDLEVVLSICIICSSIFSFFIWILLLFMGGTLLLEWSLNKIQWGYCSFNKKMYTWG